jgi:hypothetical protein
MTRVVSKEAPVEEFWNVLATVVIVNVACLPWAYRAWSITRERKPECQLRLTQHKDFAIHAAETQVVAR